MLTILCDSREQSMLTFPTVAGVIYEVRKLDVGDYGCLLEDGTMDKTVVERKNMGDLFSSFSSGYENEKAKIQRARDAGLKYVLAIEGTIFDVREGHEYRKGGELHQSKKDGLSQVRQLMTMYRKGYFDIWWCRSRQEMAFMIQEYFLVNERIKKS